MKEALSKALAEQSDPRADRILACSFWTSPSARRPVTATANVVRLADRRATHVGATERS